jgi:hypothetical protein
VVVTMLVVDEVDDVDEVTEVGTTEAVTEVDMQTVLNQTYRHYPTQFQSQRVPVEH